MKRRWLGYALIGALFGIFGFFYLIYLYRFPAERVFGSSPAGEAARFVVMFLILNIGIWLIPAVPAALAEARASRSRLRAALASLTVWCVGIISYYLTNAVQLAAGVPGREEVALASYGSPYFWRNWASVLTGPILGGMVEWAPIAIGGGLIVGFLAGALYLRRTKYTPMRS